MDAYLLSRQPLSLFLTVKRGKRKGQTSGVIGLDSRPEFGSLNQMNNEQPESRHHHPNHYAEISRPPSFFLKVVRMIVFRIPYKIKQHVRSCTWSNFVLISSSAIAIVALLYCYAFYVALIAFGFCLGYFICAPDMPTDLLYMVHKQVMNELFVPHCQVCKEKEEYLKLQRERSVRLLLPNPLHDTVLHVIDLIIRDFIDDWYLDLNKTSKERYFQNEIQKAIKGGLNILLNFLKTRQPGELCTTVTSTLCVLLQKHVKEYKKYQRLCSRGEFLKAKNILTLSPDKEQEYLHRIAAIVIGHLVPEGTAQGTVASVFVQELFANVLVKELIDMLSETAFINTQIIDFLDFEKERLFLKTKKGYCLLRIRLLRGRNIQSSLHNSDFFHVTLLMCGRKLKSKKKRINHVVEFNEEFRFKIPDNIAKHDLDNSVVVSLKETNTFKVNEYIGTFEFFPLLVNFNQENRGWHTLVDGNTGAAVGELELEYSIMKYSTAEKDLADEICSMPDTLFTGDRLAEDDDEGISFNLGHVLSSHEFFLEFYSFLTEQKAHSYLHLWVSIDSFLRAFLKSSTDTINSSDEGNIISEARMIFSSHFDENVAADNLIPLSNQDLYEYKSAIMNQSVTAEQAMEVMRKTQDFLYSLLEDFYFPLFKETPSYSMLKNKLYKEQHEAYLSGLSKVQPAEEEILKSSNNQNSVNFIGCKLECKLLGKGEKLFSSSGYASSSHSIASSRKRDTLISYLTPVTSIITGPFSKSSHVNFCIEVSLRHSFVFQDLALSSYTIVRSYSEIHHLQKHIVKLFPQLSSLYFPLKKTSGEEKQKQMEYQMQNYLNELTVLDFVCSNEQFRDFLFPNQKELRTLKGHMSGEFDDNDTAQSIKSAEYHTIDEDNAQDSASKKGFRLKNIFKSKKKPHSNLSVHGYGAEEGTSGTPSASTSQLPTPIAIDPVSKGNEKLYPPTLIIPSATAFDENSSIHSYSSGENVDFFLDSLFNLVTEAFDVSGRGQWIKRQILNTIKQVLKQTQAGSLKNLFEQEVASRFSFAHLNSYLSDLEHTVWPNGMLKQPRIFSKEEKEMLAAEAKPIFLRIMPDSMNTILGKGKVSLSLSRLFFMIQHQEYNKIFLYEAFCEILEILFLYPPNSALK